MPSIRGRKQARFRKRLKAELAGEATRQQARAEAAITATALRIFFAKEDGAVLVPPVIAAWNETAAGIEAEFGAGWFPIRLERTNAFSFRFTNAGDISLPLYGVRLTYLAAVKEDPRPYQLMNDLLFMAQLPEERIRLEATGRNSWWHRKGRKLKQNITLARNVGLTRALDAEHEAHARDRKEET
jgi:hypothetical protein